MLCQFMVLLLRYYPGQGKSLTFSATTPQFAVDEILMTEIRNYGEEIRKCHGPKAGHCVHEFLLTGRTHESSNTFSRHLNHVWPAGHVPLQRRVLRVPLALRWHASFDSLLLWLELLPLSRSNGDGLQVNLVLTVLHLWTWVTQDAKVQGTSGGERHGVITVLSYFRSTRGNQLF